VTSASTPFRVALAESLDDADVGAPAAVFVDGEPVADLWGGYKDAKKTEPWEQDTITNVWSTTKTMVALSALILADRSDPPQKAVGRRSGSATGTASPGGGRRSCRGAGTATRVR
jgi:Beta-lactamase